jgi:hypothetical protein
VAVAQVGLALVPVLALLVQCCKILRLVVVSFIPWAYPIVRLFNLPLRFQRCSRLERFSKLKENIFFCIKNARGYPWFCNSRS